MPKIHFNEKIKMLMLPPRKRQKICQEKKFEMGQKNHPLGLRIQSSTRYFDNCWYSDHFFTKLVSVDIYLSLYLNTFLKLFQLPFARFSIQHFPKTTKLYTFFCYPRQSREYKSKIFQIPSGLTSLTTKKNKNLQNNLRKHQLLFKNSIKNDVLWQSLINSPSAWKNQHPILWNKYSENQKFQMEKSNYEKWLMSIFHKNRLSHINHFTNSDYKEKLNIIKYHNIIIPSKTENLKKLLSTNFNDFGIVSNWAFLGRSINDLDTSSFFQNKKETKDFILQPMKETTQKLRNIGFSFYNIRHFASNLYMMTKQNIPYNSRLVPNTQTSISFPDINKAILHQTGLDATPSLFHFEKEQKSKIQLKYKNHIQSYISQHFNSNLQFFAFKVNQEWQDAGYFADEIVYLLERRVPFRRLKNRILKQLTLNSNIKGLRLTCSGRVGGKSKKAQRAKMDSIKYGQTSLHVFSSKIDFASRTAYTPLGSTGIKVWICYK